MTLQSGDIVPESLVYDIKAGSRVVLNRSRVRDSVLGYTSCANGLGPQKALSISTSSKAFIHGPSVRLDFNFQVTDQTEQLLLMIRLCEELFQKWVCTHYSKMFVF
jgi:hypothetical protein